MNWQSILITILSTAVVCIPGGMFLEWIMVRDKIMSKEIHIGKAKAKKGGTQDFDLEIDEVEGLTKRQQKQKDKRDKEIQQQIDKQAIEIKDKVNEALKQSNIINKLKK
jgi:hypothetical protein